MVFGHFRVKKVLKLEIVCDENTDGIQQKHGDGPKIYHSRPYRNRQNHHRADKPGLVDYKGVSCTTKENRSTIFHSDIESLKSTIT